MAVERSLFAPITILTLLSSQVTASCPYSLRANPRQTSEQVEVRSQVQNVRGAFAFPTCTKTAGKLVNYSTASLCVAYDGIRADFLKLVATLKTTAQRADLFGGALRMAFHDAVDVDLSKPISDVGGSDGCIGDSVGSAGLVEGYPNNPNPVKVSVIFKYLEPIYQKYCENINRADFFVLFSKFTVEYAEPTGTINIDFQYGRRESHNCAGPNNEYVGRDPSGQDGVNELVQTFINQMGLNNVDIVTLLGGHTLGHVHKEFSGYDGHPNDPTVTTDQTVNAWDFTPAVFDNDYYSKVRNRPWSIVFGNPAGYVNAYAGSADPTKIPAKNTIWIDEACSTTRKAPGIGHIYPSSTGINKCNSNNRGPGTKLIALNADMSLAFPLNVTNYFNPGGNHFGQLLEHCELAEYSGTRDVPLRCYGPVMKPVNLTTPFPPTAAMPHLNSFEALNIFFEDYTMRECNSEEVCCPNNTPCNAMVATEVKAWNDPTGQIQYTKAFFLPIFNVYAAGSYQDGTEVGLAAHKAFIQQFQASFKKMVTVGYSVDNVTQTNQYSEAVNSKLGSLKSFNRATAPCLVPSIIPSATPSLVPSTKPSNHPSLKPSTKPSVKPAAKK